MKIGKPELEEKIGRITTLLAQEDLAGVLLNAQHNFAWLTGGSNGIDLSRDNGAASILITAEGGRYLFANNIEMDRLRAEQVPPEAELEPIEFSWQREKAEPREVFEIASSIAKGRVASDLPLPDPSARVIEGLIARCRYSLTVDEIRRIRQLGRDAAAAMDSLPAQIVQGDSELEIAEKLRAALAAGGMTSVVTLVAADDRIETYRHPVPTANQWRRILLVVTCAKRGGLIVSLSRLISAGAVPDDLTKRTEAAAFVNASLWNATRPGVTGAELYRTAMNAYRHAGFADEIHKHHQGGAAGYRTREWVAHPESTETVLQDQAFAWNPSITGTKIEETVLVTSSGLNVLTPSRIFPSIVTEVGGITYHSPGILSL